MSQSFDVLVLGSGIAGLSFALKAAKDGHAVAILTKKTKADSNTNWAQGGIAAVTGPEDDVEKHVQDTLVAGDGLCREKIVREIVRDGPARVQELVDMGLKFSREADGSYDLGREGGHSERRILHVKDMTGKAIEDALLRAISREPRVALYEHLFGIDLITVGKGKQRRLQGLYALDVHDGRVITFRAPVIMLSTGGAGRVYQFTTNPEIATGDGIAMAFRAGVEIRNLEFIQFHPTTLFTADDKRFLISEAVRGEGAVLRNLAGEAFMTRYHHQADLAPRDIVARAIDAEMKQSGAPHVWLDITHRNATYLRKRFPKIYKTCKQLGFDLAKDYLPVVPAAHYTCGGVATNLAGETALPGLYACGEVSCTGLHGANRLASNSLLEAVVVAHRASASVTTYLKRNAKRRSLPIPEWVNLGGTDEDERVVISHNWDELRRAMWDYVGIMRTTKRLERARTRIALLEREIHDYYWNFTVDPELLELRNMATVARLIVACALQRSESRGLHAITDFPQTRKRALDSKVRLS
ncbi:L-aspartate oxidase [Synoicihabitans lomoniglobus]|uniref:L-aspartate oxidase n=1 Tax=Synoicihabitans lomoniglobus TaxID=2909285 RepID=A0AAF0CPD3_9BACT|nr:L-aspartate oxidase [Opitutaceae bacterium LMO-M01]WED64144.1 L-aspartate oxidase [Opitutaceae bacterium LMO-M01]